MRSAISLSVLGMIIMATSANLSSAQISDPVAPFRAQREAVVEGFRVGGSLDTASLVAAARGLEAIVGNASGETRARALMELGTVLRMSNNYQKAIEAQTEAAKEAQALGLRDLAFDAWIGVARANEYGPADHGAAALALDRAVDMAGEQPSDKQRADLAGYLAQLEINRGELEAGIIDALMAIRLAKDPKDRFYSESDLGDGLLKLAASCDYRPLFDAKSSDADDELYGACRRAVIASRSAYAQAGTTAAGLGWSHLVEMTRGFENDVDMRGSLIEIRAKGEKRSFGNVFHPRSSRDVLVNRNFEAGASTLTDVPGLAPLIESVVAEADAKTGRKDARSDYLLGLANDVRKAPPEAAARYYAEAAAMLAAERSGFFDPRRRGTVIENRGEIIRDLAIRLLALKREADAFAAFESMRARGLGELAFAMARPDVGAEDRRWLAELLEIEAKTSAIERRIVAEMVATGRLDAQADKLKALEVLRAERQAALKTNETARARFDVPEATPPVTLAALRAATASTGVPVLLYWTTYTNVIVWYVGPDGSDVRTVFLPASVLEEKVRAVLKSSSGHGATPFDEKTARELFLYLLGPFLPALSSASVHEIVIVPQGALTSLPFEALIDPGSGVSVVDRWAVSYAPNATMAAAALQRTTRPVSSVTALVDPIIDVKTNETESIQAAGVDLKAIDRAALFGGSWRSDALHILMHGDFNPDEALLSSVAPTGRPNESITAAALTALPLHGLRLAALSACQGGRVEARISGEIYGFPWALLTGGAEATVLSRWDVSAESNGKWMGVFYRELAQGAPAPIAAATAMREMRKSGLNHPYYWAAMQVSGR